jgi:hypothetical protein
VILRGRLSAIRYSGPLLVEVLAKMAAEVIAEVFELLVEVEVRNSSRWQPVQMRLVPGPASSLKLRPQVVWMARQHTAHVWSRLRT